MKSKGSEKRTESDIGVLFLYFSTLGLREVHVSRKGTLLFMSRRREGSASDKRKKERKKREKRTGALGSFLALVALVARGLVSLGIYSREKNERCQFVVLIEEVIDFFCGDCLGLGIDSERARFKRNVIESTEREADAL